MADVRDSRTHLAPATPTGAGGDMSAFYAEVRIQLLFYCCLLAFLTPVLCRFRPFKTVSEHSTTMLLELVTSIHGH